MNSEKILHRRIFLLLVAVLVSGFLMPGCGDSPAPKPAAAEMQYVLAGNPEGGAALDITLTTAGKSDGKTAFAIDDAWGGAGDIADQIRGLRVRDSSGRRLAVERPEPHRWVVTHAPGERLILSYSLQGASEDDRGRHRYLPVVQKDLILLIGHSAFVRPEDFPDDGEVDLTIRWEGFSNQGWNLVSSFGPCDGVLRVKRPLVDVVHAFFAAGKIRLHERRIAGAPLHLALAGIDWRFGGEPFCDMVARIMEFERVFFEDSQHPPYTVFLVPYPGKKPDSSSKGGTNLTDSFVLYLTPQGYPGEDTTGLEPLETLITHEYFHNWNKPGPDDDAMHWFSEGFTVFYERRILFRLGMITAEEYVDHLNRKIRDYATSPHKQTPNDVYVQSRMLDQELQELPYVRGAVIAVMVDHEIRRLSGGGRNLDDFMRDKFEKERARSGELRNEEVFGMLAAETSQEFADAIRAIAIEGEPATIALDTYNECLAIETKHLAPFELGFDFEASLRDKVVEGVREDTNAYAAGLRDGQRLTSWSVTHGSADRQVRLGVVENNIKVTITYLPQATPVAVQQFRLFPDSVERCSGVF